jgi:hypothetical protein
MEKKEHSIILFLILALALLALSGCYKKTEIIICSSPSVVLGDKCCMDANNNSVCDDTEVSMNQSLAGICGNNACEENENCSTCWKDCGACKRIVYIYMPGNFTLAEISLDINDLTRDGIKFRRDLDALNNMSDFFYYNRAMPRYIADFMGAKYKPLVDSRNIILSKVIPESFYVNDSVSLFNFVNYSNWYLLYAVKSKEMADYELRITSGHAKDDYPTQPSGYQKEYRYVDWEYRNFSRDILVVNDSMTLLPDGMVESVYAGINYYNVTYKYHEFRDIHADTLIEAFKDVEEHELNYVQTLSFICARNLVVTLYGYGYDESSYNVITPEVLASQIPKTRESLIYSAEKIKYICDKKYSNKVFVPG